MTMICRFLSGKSNQCLVTMIMQFDQFYFKHSLQTRWSCIAAQAIARIGSHAPIRWSYLVSYLQNERDPCSSVVVNRCFYKNGVELFGYKIGSLWRSGWWRSFKMAPTAGHFEWFTAPLSRALWEKTLASQTDQTDSIFICLIENGLLEMRRLCGMRVFARIKVSDVSCSPEMIEMLWGMGRITLELLRKVMTLYCPQTEYCKHS